MNAISKITDLPFSAEFLFKKLHLNFICHLSLIIARFKPYQKISIKNEFLIVDFLNEPTLNIHEKEKLVQAFIVYNPKDFFKYFINIIDLCNHPEEFKHSHIFIENPMEIKNNFSSTVFNNRNLLHLKKQFKEEVLAFLEENIEVFLKDFINQDAVLAYQESYISIALSLFEKLASSPYSSDPKKLLYNYIISANIDLINTSYADVFEHLNKRLELEQKKDELRLNIAKLIESYDFIIDRFKTD